ncbi:Vitamin B12-binding protein precursor [compost metagenome]
MSKAMLKRFMLLVVVLTLALSAAACAKQNTTTEGMVDPAQLNPAATKAPEAGTALKTQYPLKVKDATGLEFTFDKAPERIVSVSPAETEALFAIGLGDKIIGVSDYDDYPEAAKSKPKMGSITKPNQESLMAANADIVFTGISMKKDTVEKLRESKIKLFKVEPKTVDDVIADILLFGQITDRQKEANEVVAKMKAERQKVTDAVKGVTAEKKKKVYLEFSPGWSVGNGEFLDELIQLAGGINVAAETKGWHQISEEKIIQQNPAVIFYASGFVDDKSKKSLDELIRGRSGWDKIEAVANKQVIGVEQNLLTRPGPRMTEGLIIMAKAIYPELVK